MGTDAPTPVVLPVPCAPTKAPCPKCGQHGKRTRILPPRQVRTVMSKTVAFLAITGSESRARCACCQTFRNTPGQVLPPALDDTKVRDLVLGRLRDDGLERSPGFVDDVLRDHARRLDMAAHLGVFPGIKAINKLVRDAVRRLRSAMARRGQAGRQKQRGRQGAKSQVAAARRGMTVQEQAHFVFQHCHLVVQRRENLTDTDRDDRTRRLESLPELATLRHFADRISRRFDTPQDFHQASGRRAAIVRDATFQAVPEWAKALKQRDEERFPKPMASWAKTVRKRVGTNNQVERTKWMFRLLEKVRSKGRRRQTLVRFVVLTWDRIGSQRAPSRPKTTEPQRVTAPVKTEDERSKRRRAA